MAVSNDVLKGQLTTSFATLRTGANAGETLMVAFRNSGGSTRVVTVALNGTADPDDVKATISLQPGWRANVKTRLGNGDTIDAKQDTGTDVFWFIEALINP